MGLLAILAWIAFSATVALCIAAFLILAPDTPEDASDEQAHGDIPTIPSAFHHDRGR